MTKPLFDVFRAAMMRNPNASRKEAQDDFVARMKADPAYFELLAIDYFERMAAVYVARVEGPTEYSFTRTGAAQGRVERMSKPRAPKPELVRRTREEAEARTATAFAEMKAKIRDVVLLDLIMPSGKALRDATGAECRRAGGFYADVARALKPTQVVDRHLTEEDLQNIRARHYQKNEAEAA